MEPSRIRVSVIVLFYWGERWIDSCIHSLENQSLPRDLYEIILVDNGGSTPSVDKYKGKRNMKVLHFPANYGFAGGNNRALEYCGGEIVVLVNQDVLVHYNCLQELLDVFDSYPEAGAISANMLMVSSDDIIDQHSQCTREVGLYRLSPFGYASYSVQETEEPVVPVDFVSGNGLAFRRSILTEIGHYLFDSRLGSYMEDLDLSIRLKRTKWKMYVRPMAVLYHFRDEAFSGKLGHMLRKLIHVSSNRLIVYYNNLSTRDFLRRLPSLISGIPFKVARLDGEAHFSLSRFVIALGLAPAVLVYFLLRVFLIAEHDPY
jgi:GT2 family glycosyltransferase